MLQYFLDDNVKFLYTQRHVKTGFYISLLVNPLLALLALSLSVVDNSRSNNVSLVFFYAIGSASALVRLGFYLYHCECVCVCGGGVQY